LSKISDKDKKDWEKFLLNNESLPDKDTNFSIKNSKRINKIDLHGFSLSEANKKIKNFILYSFTKKIYKLIVITGKGIHSENIKDPYVSKDLGILKYSVPEFIKNSPELMNLISRIDEASIKDGGEGAFYIYLKKKL
tara:strand:+ start:367 stop:777 length:411 start_codon:yes stop_codon:yes gene_type:complete